MSETMQHRGYEGSVEYSAEDRLLHGRLIGIRDFILYDGEDIPTLETNFRGAVDEYLEFCRVEGRTPHEPQKEGFEIIISQDLHMRAARYAKENNKKLNGVVSDALQEFLAKAS